MTTRRTVLITGGSAGIGLGLAERFMAAGDRVMVTGRDPRRLEAARDSASGLLTAQSDIGVPGERERLAARIADEFAELDLLVNNAGIQRRVPLADDRSPWSERQAELDALLGGPVHLTQLLIPVMLAHGRPAIIINVTSGGALIPQPFAPLYSAAKAALHSYTMTLRDALAETAVDVLELIPPAVATGLSGSPTPHGADVAEFCDAAFRGIQDRRQTIGFGATDSELVRQRLQLEQQMFDASRGRFPVRRYEQRANISRASQPVGGVRHG